MADDRHADGSLARRHDALLVDLDGTVALAGHPIEHAASTLQRARELGARVLIVTNNASRTPRAVADRLAAIGIPLGADDVVSSPLAAAQMLARSHHRGEHVLIVGTDALADAIADAGLVPVRSADDGPVAVVQGHSPDTGWRELAEACAALRAGADWVATNTDTTLPTDRGLMPGNGAMVQALVTATGRTPRVAGKPSRPLLDAAAERAGARCPLVVGDRLDTDIAAAVAAGMPSLLVLSGVSTAADLLAAPPAMRPTVVARDLRGLVDPAGCVRLAPVDGAAAEVPDAPYPDDPAPDAGDQDPPGARGWRVTVAGRRLELMSAGGPAEPLEALGALAEEAWRTGIAEVRAGDDAAAAALAELGLG